MNKPARTVIIGKDEGPIEVLSSVLIRFWGVRKLVGHADENPSQTFGPEDDVVVLCESFSEAERQAWVDRVRSVSPTLLIVKMNGYDAGPHAGADATVDHEHGPAALVSTIFGLLTERGRSSRGWSEQAPSLWLQ